MIGVVVVEYHPNLYIRVAELILRLFHLLLLSLFSGTIGIPEFITLIADPDGPLGIALAGAPYLTPPTNIAMIKFSAHFDDVL
jgi:hypothetical protein